MAAPSPATMEAAASQDSPLPASTARIKSDAFFEVPFVFCVACVRARAHQNSSGHENIDVDAQEEDDNASNFTLDDEMPQQAVPPAQMPADPPFLEVRWPACPAFNLHRSKQVGLVPAADEPCYLLSRRCNNSAIAQHCESRRRQGVRSRTRRTRRSSGSCEPASRRWRWTPAARARRRSKTGRCRRRQALRRARSCRRWGRSWPSSG